MKKLILSMLMLGILMLFVGSVSAVTTGSLHPDYAYCNMDGLDSSSVCTSDVDDDDSDYKIFDDGEIVDVRWDSSTVGLSFGTDVTNVNVYVYARRKDNNDAFAKIEKWDGTDLTNQQEWTGSDWQLKTFSSTDLTNYVISLLGSDQKLSVRIDDSFLDRKNLEVDYIWLEIEYEPACEVIVDSPLPNSWWDPIDVAWHYEGNCDPIEYNLFYQPDDCDADGWIKFEDGLGSGTTDYNWNTNLPISDGQYCIAVNMDQENAEDVTGHSGLFNLDVTPPVVIKTVGKPSVLVDPQCNPQEEECDYYVTQQTPITLNCDDGPDGSGINNIAYRINGGLWQDYHDPFTFSEDSEHILEVECGDNVEKYSEIHTETFYVDTVAPTIEKTVGEPKIPCSEFDIAMFDENFQGYTYTDGEDLYLEMDANGWVIIDSHHPDDVFLRDDDTPGDYYVVIRDDSSIIAHFDTTSLGYIKLSYDRRTYSITGHHDELRVQWRAGDGDSWHELEAVNTNAWKSMEFDLFGGENQEDLQIRFFLHDGNNDYGFVDDIVVMGRPLECDYYVTQDTEFTFDCVDPDPHPVDDVTIYVNAYGSQNGQDWDLIHEFSEHSNQMVFTNHEDSWHKFEYWCEDSLGNPSERIEEIDIVDSQAPDTIKWYEGPQHQVCLGERCWPYLMWIDGITTVVLNAIDRPEEHSVDWNSVNYKVIGPVDDEYCYQPEVCDSWQASAHEDQGWNSYIEPFGIDEESCHIIEYYSVDALGNTEDVDWQCTFVDKTPPITHKEVGEPAVECTLARKLLGVCEDNWDWKITMDTPVYLSCEDQQPHPSGADELCWRLTLDGDIVYGHGADEDGWVCGETDEVTLRFHEESEHLLEFYCADHVDKTSEIDSELFKVEGEEFRIPIHDKWNLISIPFNLLTNNITEVFSQMADKEVDIEGVWGYEDGNWSVYSPEGPSDLETMDPGYGYWIKADCDVEQQNQNGLCGHLVVGGSLLGAGPGIPPSRELQSEWNLIGHYGTQSDSAYCSLFSLVDTTIGHPRWSALYGYNPIQDQFNALNTEDQTYAGRGYWLEMDVTDRYSPATACWGFGP